MRRLICVILLIALFILPVSAMEMEAPTVPETAKEVFPNEVSSFGHDLWYILKKAAQQIKPSISEAAKVCISVVAVSVLVSTASHLGTKANMVCELVGAVAVGVLMLSPLNSLIKLGTQTIDEMSQYSKLLLPVMTAALAAQGGVSASCGLYAGTAFLNSILSSLISKLLVPMLYVYLCLSIACCAVKEQTLKRLSDCVKGTVVWSLKLLLYVFTGYMSITGVISGATDASAIKATKLAISGCVPVVGGMLSDASESILISATVMKNAAGIYGVLAIIAICIVPFLRIAVQYLMLKLTSAVCAVTGVKYTNELIDHFTAAMGICLAMTGTVCILQLISTICFMKGVG